MKKYFTQLGIYGIVIELFVLAPYSVYLRFTTQTNYFCWPWNASAEVQELLGWQFVILFVSIAFFQLGSKNKG
jgi:hypothetical protein